MGIQCVLGVEEGGPKKSLWDPRDLGEPPGEYDTAESGGESVPQRAAWPLQGLYVLLSSCEVQMLLSYTLPLGNEKP